MNTNLQSPTKLTEFAPLQPEEKQQSVGQLISRFFKFKSPGGNGDQASNSSNVEHVSVDNISQESLPTWAIDKDSSDSHNSLANVYSVDVAEGRSLPNVLKRISNLLSLKSTNLQAYSDSELKAYWMPDSVSKECYECCERFTTFRRRHHCRVCGQIFCSSCCNQQIPGKIFGCTGDLRVCTYCCKVVLSYLQSSDIGSDLTADLRALQENLQSKYGVINSNTTLNQNVLRQNSVSCESLEPGNTLKRKISVGYQEEKFASGRASVSYLTTEEKCRALQNSASLRNLYEEICRPNTGIPLRTHRHRLRTYTACMLGTELVDWLICQQKASTRIQASAICQALLEGGYIECISDPCIFVDGYAIYKPGTVSTPEVTQSSRTFENSNQDEPSWIQYVPQESSTTDSENEQVSPTSRMPVCMTSSSSYTLDLNIGASTVYLSRPPPSNSSLHSEASDADFEKHKSVCTETPSVRTSEQREFVPESGWYNASILREENGEKEAYDLLTNAFSQHENSLLHQLLSVYALPLSWSDIILPLIHEIVDVIRPDISHDAEELDIRQYIKFKKISGGNRTNSELIRGIVCSKNVAHKGMPTKLENPKILLLEGSIVYQRTEGRLMSLEPVLMQENEYLKHVAARIIALQPDIVLVQKNVSRLAQDLLREHGVSLVINVKQRILEKISRCTQADLVNAVDAHIGRPRLGTCKKFYLKSFSMERGSTKTLMFFEGLPVPHLGGTLLLRGASKPELVNLKSVASLLLFACYNWRLEKSFLMDEFAQPPNNKDEFFGDSKETSPVNPIPDISIGDKENNDREKKARKLIKSKEELFGSENNLFGNENDTEYFTKTDKADEQKIKRIEDKKELTESVEDKRILTESIKDFSDPLHSYNTSDDVFKENNLQKLSVSELPFSNHFRKSLDDTILCISPYLVFSVPYLETENGKKCKLRSFFPVQIYFSEQFLSKKKKKSIKETDNVDLIANANGTVLRPPHPFITTKICTSVNTNQIQTLLANFRACGGRVVKKPVLCVKNSDIPEKLKCETDIENIDVLNPKNHQRMAVLFCSFSHESSNAPAFCVNPWVVYMDFYGRNDIPLGCFLERYCFKSTYTCQSKCDTPMLKHIRRFVHYSGCVSISLNNFVKENPEDNIVMWSWCSKCQNVSPIVPMSVDTWSFSFAKYLELRFHGSIYSRRGNSPCQHSLHHDHHQYFAYQNTVASFKYASVELWEISLPPSIINIQFDTPKQQLEMIDEIKTLSLKGHEIYALIGDRLSFLPNDVELVVTLKQLLLKEHLIFRQKIEEIQIKLTSPTIENKIPEFHDPKMEVQYAVWRINDSLVRIKRVIVEAVEQWNLRLSDTVRKKDDKKKDKKEVHDLDSPGSSEIKALLTENSDSEGTNSQKDGNSSDNNGISTKKNKSLDQGDEEIKLSSSPKCHQRSQSDGTVLSQLEDTHDSKCDRKMVKNIFSLFASTPFIPLTLPFTNQGHYTLPTGVYAPIAVYESEPSSIVAYALNSFDYKKSLEEITGKKLNSAENTPSPVHKRRNQSENKESGEFNLSVDKGTSLLSFLRNKDIKAELAATATNILENNQSYESVPVEKVDDSKKNKITHIEIQFEDTNCNFFCRVFYAEKFSILRKTVLPIGEEAYIRSLSRSIQWNARGGKSGSTFCKTTDDRFILKEMPKSEVQLFLESAPNYFTYMQRCFTTAQPTLLGKIVGIYQIIYRNITTSATLRTYLLVMENLFYNRVVTQKFDLKGSMRNRLVNPDNQDGEIVLLDENLLKMTCDSPLYILPHSKAVLTAAILNDTEFLSTQSVMDYSLLVGLDSENKELVLGIIDYIRTFTWDKKLETMVKKSGLLGGQGKLPTIMPPQEYQKRFIEAMHRYFLEVPDPWAGLGKGLEC